MRAEPELPRRAPAWPALEIEEPRLDTTCPLHGTHENALGNSPEVIGHRLIEIFHGCRCGTPVFDVTQSSPTEQLIDEALPGRVGTDDRRYVIGSTEVLAHPVDGGELRLDAVPQTENAALPIAQDLGDR